MPDGIYIRGSVGGYPVLFTADTGASKTVLSKRVYDAMKSEDKPSLSKSSKLIGAGGAIISEVGKGSFKLQLGPVQLQTDAIVAEIEDDGLLGIDVLQNRDDGPADILMSKGVLRVAGKEVPIIQVGMQNRVRRVTAADHYVIPAQSEAVIDVYVERQEYDDFSSETDYIIEPTTHFKETYPLQMASTLVDINNACSCKVRVLNPFPTAMSIKQDAVLGLAEPIEGRPAVLAKQEDENEADNNVSTRRVVLCEREEMHSPLQEPETARNVTQKNLEVPVHLTDLYERTTTGLDRQQKEKIAGLLTKFQDSFSRDEMDLGLTHLTEHSIPTGDAAPVKQPPRRVPLAHAGDEKKAIEDLKAKGVIRDSVSPWASPIVLVAKKDGGVRPCVDYRRVNQLVKPDGFPLPRIQDCLDSVAGSTLFSTFDLTSGYFQIPVKEEDICKTAFVCKYGHFEMTRMPFGLNNSASTFQRTMEMVLQGLQWVTCLIYIDDIIVFGKDFHEHLQRVEEVFNRIKAAGLKLKPAKSHMLQEEVVFLGHVVSGEGVRPSPTNITKILDWPRPKTVRQIKQFVAMGSYYRRYIKDFASLVRPMINLTKKGQKFIWSSSCEEAFVLLKKALISTDIMGYPLNEAGEFILDVDASGVGIGAVLHQIQGDRERVIAYASRALNKAESNYCITEKELLAVRYFIEYFRQYLLGRRFLVRSDHQSLVWLFQLKEPRGKIARWIEILSQYDFAIQYRPGRKQTHCDALSRCENPRSCDCPDQDTTEPLKCGPCKKCIKRAQDMMHERLFKELEAAGSSGKLSPKIELNSIDQEEQKSKDQEEQKSKNQEVAKGIIQGSNTDPGTSSQANEKSDSSKPVTQVVTSWFQNKSVKDLRSLQDQDPDIGPILKAMATSRRPSSQEMTNKSPAARHYWILWDSLLLQDSLLFKKFVKKDGSGQHLQFIVPRVMKSDILFQMHDSLLSGHLGTKKTKEKVLQRFYWYALKEDIKIHIQKCDICAADKKPTKIPRAPLGCLPAGAPGDCVATDYLGPLPLTDRGNRYILLLTDHFSKYVEILPVPDMTAEVCASKILNEFISRWGCPLSIHSDQGRTYESEIFKQLCRMLEIRKTRTSARNPRANGQSERFNRTLLRMIKAYLCGEQSDWDLHLGCLAGAYRATPNESTRLTPNMLTTGREVRLPAELVLGSKNARDGMPITSYGDYVDQLRQRMQHAHEIARRHLSSAAQRSKDIYDAKIAFNKYNVGDAVWCLLESRQVGVTPKLQHTYEGPYLITKKLSEINFLLQLDMYGKSRLVHHNKLKPYEGDQPPSWLVRAKKKMLRTAN
ncbi:MAG: reverse transcriptase domain-containing protein [Candidatus Thiodiazotropha sp.]